MLVCQDGFTITHSAEPVTLLEDDEVVRFVGDYSVPHALDTSRPTTQRAVRHARLLLRAPPPAGAALELALDAFTEVAAEYEQLSERDCGCSRRYRLEGAERAIVALGSSAGTIKDVVDDLRAEGEPVGMLKIVSFPAVPCSARGGASGK